VFVEYEPQTRVEGEIQQMPADFPVTEFWRVLTGAATGRSSAQQVTLFDSVGFALEDHSALTFLRDAAAELGIGSVIDLVPAAADPKDLFGVLRGDGSSASARPVVVQTEGQHGRRQVLERGADRLEHGALVGG
jgi:ornithine cyclodeaminase